MKARSDQACTMRRRLHNPRFAGFTLFEMLLVLALLVTVMVLTFPTMARLQVEHQLKQAVELVRLELAATRLNAMQSGMDYQFRYEPGGIHFLSVPAEYQAVQAQQQANQTSGNSAPDAVYWRSQGQFTAKLTFTNAQTDEAATTAPLPRDFLTGFDQIDELARINWGPPLVFKADGSARDFSVEIENDRGQYVTLTVRGITGMTSVSQVFRRVRR